jgi:tetratricopeptide (TPR) repeat protein
MKPAILFLFLLISTFSLGQAKDDSTGAKMFDRGLEFYNKGHLDSALRIWTEIVDKKIGVQYDTYGGAFYNIPTIYWKMKDYAKAKEWYLKVLASDLRDSDETGSLMDPHANYKHKSALALAGLAQLDSNYTETLEWLNKADTVYRYWGYEGSLTSVSIEQASLLTWKANTLMKLNRKEEAIRAIVTELICARSLETYFTKSEDLLFLTLIVKPEFKADLDKAMDGLLLRKISDTKWKASFQLHGIQYQIPLSNRYPDLSIPHYWSFFYVDKNGIPTKTSLLEDIKQRHFYKRLTE